MPNKEKILSDVRKFYTGEDKLDFSGKMLKTKKVVKAAAIGAGVGFATGYFLKKNVYLATLIGSISLAFITSKLT